MHAPGRSVAAGVRPGSGSQRAVAVCRTWRRRRFQPCSSASMAAWSTATKLTDESSTATTTAPVAGCGTGAATGYRTRVGTGAEVTVDHLAVPGRAAQVGSVALDIAQNPFLVEVTHRTPPTSKPHPQQRPRRRRAPGSSGSSIRTRDPPVCTTRPKARAARTLAVGARPCRRRRLDSLGRLRGDGPEGPVVRRDQPGPADDARRGDPFDHDHAPPAVSTSSSTDPARSSQNRSAAGVRRTAGARSAGTPGG